MSDFEIYEDLSVEQLIRIKIVLSLTQEFDKIEMINEILRKKDSNA